MTTIVTLQCPYCNQFYASHGLTSVKTHSFDRDTCYGAPIAVETAILICANKDCQKPTVFVAVGIQPKTEDERGRILYGHLREPGAFIILDKTRILPEPGGAFFEHVPARIWQDYHEACLIKDLSPRASATIARRCLQAMIRDFWGISKENLKQEINAVASSPGVSKEVTKALHDIRELGNIGAHPEKDINVIVDIEPGEVDLMIGVIEMLFESWYEARATQARLLGDIEAMAAKKREQRNK